ncbi:hypothetical protein BJP36_20455 [Moorena producens JHB]|uniref:Uncharacterized protein n=1 Tax=Moorena producens (strain JHB) TaxID=1454205 RepID=A0A1D9G303_MOOP1|nr:hypothetical protein [Moorena producens]AOY81921.1 hypothetical protein BJP36_20455 [Moorena producens JHB]
MGKSIIELVDELPTDNITVTVLNVLDFVVPGEWENLVGFDNTICSVTGKTYPDVIESIRARALELYEDPDQGYQTAIWIYQTLDNTDTAIAAAALADKVGDTLSWIPFLDKLTPKADTVQSVDLSIKLVGELIAHSKIHGLGFNPVDFAASVAENYHKEALMRMVALVCIDGLIPLGADFMSKVRNSLDEGGESALADNPAFAALSDSIPESDKQGFISNTFDAVGDWMDNLISSTGLSPESLFDRLGGFIEVADDKLDYVAAFLDASTNCYEHTGIQTVARHLIQRAAQDI